jgi:hypothetical protein
LSLLMRSAGVMVHGSWRVEIHWVASVEPPLATIAAAEVSGGQEALFSLASSSSHVLNSFIHPTRVSIGLAFLRGFTCAVLDLFANKAFGLAFFFQLRRSIHLSHLLSRAHDSSLLGIPPALSNTADTITTSLLKTLLSQ